MCPVVPYSDATWLPQQCKYFNIRYPRYLKQWINIKKAYCDHQGNYARGMMAMMSGLALKHEGRHHSGIDDCKNIAKILQELAQRGFIYRTTGAL
ncbi:ERI1 exoribonuclease 3 [Lamellibrachia satsuma]|nr:ERI1 exoribonuclease 3 [Lamellibrachia satsuma]